MRILAIPFERHSDTLHLWLLKEHTKMTLNLSRRVACRPSAFTVHRRVLYVADQEKNNHDNEEQAHAAHWVITPSAAIRPSRQRADKQQDQNDNQDDP